MRQLSPGSHEIVLEYFEAGADAVMRLAYEQTAEPPPPSAATRGVRCRALRQQHALEPAGAHADRRHDRLPP
jgi:hypothetical protein